MMYFTTREKAIDWAVSNGTTYRWHLYRAGELWGVSYDYSGPYGS